MGPLPRVIGHFICSGNIAVAIAVVVATYEINIPVFGIGYRKVINFCGIIFCEINFCDLEVKNSAFLQESIFAIGKIWKIFRN